MGLSAVQISAMNRPIQQELNTYCPCCNKPAHIIKELPCEHPICSECNERTNFDNKNLGLPGICQSCGFIYLTGDVISFHGRQVNKEAFSPALIRVSTKETAVSFVSGLIVLAAVRQLDNSPRGQVPQVLALATSMICFETYFKFQKMNKVLTHAKIIAPDAPLLSSIMEKRINAFKLKFGMYSLAKTLILPATIGIGVAVANYKKDFIKNHETKLLFTYLGAYVLSDIMLDKWGSNYESIPKLK